MVNKLYQFVKSDSMRGGATGGPPMSARSEARTSIGGESRQDPEQKHKLLATLYFLE